MKKLLLVMLCFISCAENHSSEKTELPQSKLNRQIQQWLSQTGIPSVSYVLIRNGNIYKQDALGYANVRQKIPATVETFYNPGSNFKTVTASAIMQLKDKGLLNIDAPVNTYLKTPITYYDPESPITARHLMSHQAGLSSSVTIIRLWNRTAAPTLDEIRNQIKPQYRPGEKYQYSNDGYAILGSLIEDITGQSYEEYIWEQILKPIGVNSIGFLKPTPEMIENLALPYHIRYNKAYATDQLRLARYPSGDVYLKPADMVKFLKIHLNNGVVNGKKILSEKSVKEMHQSNSAVTNDFHYGLGIGIEKTKGTEYLFHQGSLPGYLAAFRMDPKTKMAVYLATNVSAAPMQEDQLKTLLELLWQYTNTGKIMEINPPVSLNLPEKTPGETDLSKYIGKYRIKNTPVYLKITNSGKQLYLINPANQRFRIERFAANKFFLTIENEDLHFEEEGGKIKHVTLSSGDKVITAIKE